MKSSVLVIFLGVLSSLISGVVFPGNLRVRIIVILVMVFFVSVFFLVKSLRLGTIFCSLQRHFIWLCKCFIVFFALCLSCWVGAFCLHVPHSIVLNRAVSVYEQIFVVISDFDKDNCIRKGFSPDNGGRFRFSTSLANGDCFEIFEIDKKLKEIRLARHYKRFTQINYQLEVGEPKYQIHHDFSILFENNSDWINGNGLGEIAKLKALVKSGDEYKIIILGYASSPGDEFENDRLSVRRVKAFQDVLLHNEVHCEQILNVAFGERLLLYDDSSKNRRVDVYVVTEV